MKKYKIKLEKKDFKFLDISSYNTKGSRIKKFAIDLRSNEKAFFKYERYNVSETCSEKVSYELAKVLGYDCAKIELAKDSNGVVGVLNYYFTEEEITEHIDAVAYLNINVEERPKFYTISNIKRKLDELDVNLFYDFIKIMIFDALVGETDRHEENWGILRLNGKYRISPLYDNGCNLLREFKNEELAKKYYDNIKSFDAYVNKSQTLIYKEDNKSKYKHFELIKYLSDLYGSKVQEELRKLEKLTDEKIIEIVGQIPDELITYKHKEFMIKYIKLRRNILLNIK